MMLAGGVQGVADRGGDDHLVAVDHHRLLHRTPQAFGNARRVDATVDEHDELVAAEACQQVADAHHRAEAAGDVLEQLVADAVAEAVVDHLEVVEVEEQHGDLADAGAGEQLVEARDDRRTVGELGELVVRGCVGQLGGHALLGDVLDVGDRERNAVVLGDRHLGLRPDELAVTADVALLEL